MQPRREQPEATAEPSEIPATLSYPLPARRPSNGIITQAGRCCGGPRQRSGEQLAGLPPLFEAASCRSVANSPHLPACDFLLTSGWTRGRQAWVHRCSPRGHDPPWLVVPHVLATSRGMEGAILPQAGSPIALLFADGATHHEFCFRHDKIEQGMRRKSVGRKTPRLPAGGSGTS